MRQLNLYGFTSSRHKDNSDVVVWSHQYFHRDRKDQLHNMKRMVKKPAKKPRHVYVSPRSTSASVSSEEVTSSPSNEEGVFSRQVSAKGDEWLESELAYLKQQNRHLEEKLDLLLKITLTLSPSSLEEFQLGDKRRRTYGQPPHPQSYQRSHAALDTIRENRAMPKTNNSIEPMPYKNEKPVEAGSEESMKAFVEIMLSDEEKEEAINSGSDSDIDDAAADSLNAPNVTSGADDVYEDELMSEAMLFTNDLGDSDFNLSFDETEELPESTPAPAAFHSVANRAVDKSSGPDAVLSTDSYNFDGDIEEGNVPMGVHIISAHAELVDDESKGDDSVNDRRAWRKKMMCMMTVMFVILLVVCITVPAVILTQQKKPKPKNRPSINIYVDDEHEQNGRPFHEPQKPNQGNGFQGGFQEELTSIRDDDEYYAFGDAALNTINATAETRSGSITNIFSGIHERQGMMAQTHRPIPGDFTLNIEGFDFKCTQIPSLL